ncbi:hypothetical protein CYY_003378 [Polysphondylium violaceum]|uniref:Amino acid transporter transmembrane domain-containing protein n=1 Tax=Polysphondylium violaceum TaxID=133409 RepID=A0A8J4UUC4_9MYCE|nr:hypothetical protein CYY_003378 [Polysphondylium violaceum]
MAGGAIDGTYSKKTAFVYIFNLVVGVGAIAMPIGFAKAGLVFGLLMLMFVGFLAFITSTFIIEASAAANYILKHSESAFKPLIKDEDFNSEEDEEKNYRQRHQQEYDDDIVGLVGGINRDDHDDLIEDGLPMKERGQDLTQESDFEIEMKTEVGEMAKMFLGDIGYKLFYVVLIFYLFGDLSIYSVTVPQSLASVTGGFMGISDHNIYYLYLSFFGVFVAIMCQFNFQKTKYLQIFTLITRNSAFFIMIILCLIFIAQGKGASISEIKIFDITEFGATWSVLIYAFMMHHSIPSIVTPIEKKSKLNLLLGMDLIMVFLAYSLLCVSSLFAFGAIKNPTCTPNNLHTFIPCAIQPLLIFNFSSYNVKIIAVFLNLFPVFTLSTNYILICITLRNNVMKIITWKSKTANPAVRTGVFSLIISVLPIGIGFITRDIDFLVSITGSYCGLGIMLIMPVLISYFSNKVLKAQYGVKNKRKSPFAHPAVYIIIIMISFGALIIATYKNITTYFIKPSH